VTSGPARRGRLTGRRHASALTPAVDSTSRRLRLVLQLLLLVGLLVGILLYGGVLGERAAGCASQVASPAETGTAPAR